MSALDTNAPAPMGNMAATFQQCAPEVHPDTLRRIVHVESSFNPYAIGVVGAHLARQPRQRDEAVATAQWLKQNGYDFSVGLGQVNQSHFAQYGLTLQAAFEPCSNLQVAGDILKGCYLRASKAKRGEQVALRDAFSCYYSGNFTTGYRQGYVDKVVAATVDTTKVIPVVPDISTERTKRNTTASRGMPPTRLANKALASQALLDAHEDPDIVKSALLF